MKRISVSIIAAVLMLIMCAGLVLPGLAEGTAPVAENLELETYRNVTVGGKLSAYDPDGGELKFEITTQPVKGHIELQTDGCFTYTPNTDKKGKDYFGYTATDSDGNVSQEATAVIRINKQKKPVSYADMKGQAGEYYAVYLSERDIYTGRELCGEYCFEPDGCVTKAEFLTMCMAAIDEPLITGVVRTGYTDDESIDEWMKPYVMTAVMCGVQATAAQDDLRPDEPLTRNEAMVILNRALGLNDVSYLEPDGELTEEIAQACVTLSATGIVKETVKADEKLSRVECAEMLVKAMDLIRNRK